MGTGPSSAPSKTSAVESTTTTSTPSTTGAVDYTAIDAELKKSNLSPEEQQAIRAVYGSVYNNDQAEADKLVANLALGTAYADPLLKQKVAMMTDEIKRSYTANGEDLQYQEQQLTTKLNDLKNDVATQGKNLTLDEQAQLRDLERQYTAQLGTLQDSLMSAGFTQSSRRNVKEGVLSQAQGDMVESTRRKFATAQQDIANSLDRGTRDTTAEIERLRLLTQRSNTDLARNAEQQLGTDRVSALPELSGISPVGGITGQADLQYKQDAASFIF
jgi:hypothetical protein